MQMPAAPDYRLAPRALLLAGLAVGVVATGVAMASASTELLVLVLGAFAGLSVVLTMRSLRRPLLAALFFLAPIDISKAIIAPLTSRYYPAGPYFSPGLYLSLAQMVLLLLVVVWLGRRIVLERRMPPVTALDAMAFAYLAFIWIRSIGTPQGLLSVGTAASYSLAVLGFYMVSHAIKDRADLRLAMWSSLAVLGLTVLWVGAQAVVKSPLLLPGAKGVADGAVVSLGSAPNVFRPAGFMAHPNALAHYLVIVLPMALALLLMGWRRLPGRTWLLALAVTCGAGVALLVTLSRGGWAAGVLAGFVVVALYAWKKVLNTRQLGALALAGVMGAAVLVAVYPNILLRLTAPDSRSLESRVLLADMAYTIIKSHPAIGVGFGEFNRAAYQQSPPLFANVSAEYQLQLHQLVVHNHYLLFAAELGIPAVIFFVYLLWRFARQAMPLERWRNPTDLALAVGLTGSMVAQAFFLNSDNYYTDIRIFLLWLSAGSMQALTLVADREARR